LPWAAVHRWTTPHRLQERCDEDQRFDIAVLTDSDLKAMFAYLKSMKPVQNPVPPPIPPKGP
jgi:hypothetical protein